MVPSIDSSLPLAPALAAALFWIAVAACGVAQVFILRGVFSPASEQSAAVPTPRRASEFVWALLPAFLLAAVFWFAWRVLFPGS